MEPRQIDPKNPFAEWEDQQKKPAAQARPAQDRPVQTQAQPRPQSRPAPAPQPKRAAAETEFSLEDILAEFSDK